MRNRMILGVTAAMLAAVLLGGAPSSAQAPAPPAGAASVTVVHGLRGELVDVYLDGKLALKGFQPERVTDPLKVPAGDHRVILRTAGSPADGTPMATANVKVAAGANLSLVGHLNTDGEPTVTAYDNNVSPLPAGKARLVARSTAEISAITLVVNGDPLAPLAPEGEFGADLAPATYQVAVNAPNGGVIVPPDDVPVPEGTATIMYLIGSRSDRNLIWIGQSIAGLQVPPAAVPTGNSGLVAPPSPDHGPLGPWGGAGLAAAFVGLAIGLVLLRGRRTV